MTFTPPRVAVIGAGISGLTTGKMLADYGVPYECFESSDRIGGNWAQRGFDALVVANGHHWDPRIPDFPGKFTGETIHSHHHIDPSHPLDLHGKRTLVVGIGNSAADVRSRSLRAVSTPSLG